MLVGHTGVGVCSSQTWLPIGSALPLMVSLLKPLPLGHARVQRKMEPESVPSGCQVAKC